MAQAALAGIDPLNFARCESEVEMAFLRLVASKAIETDGKYREDQANRTIRVLSQALGGNKRQKSGANTSTTS